MTIKSNVGLSLSLAHLVLSLPMDGWMDVNLPNVIIDIGVVTLFFQFEIIFFAHPVQLINSG
jgi:hypothetical protein